MKGIICFACLVVGATCFFSSTNLSGADVLRQKLLGRWELDPQRSRSLGGKSALVVDQYQRGRIRMFLEFRPDDTAITTVISPSGRHATPSNWNVVKENVRAITFELKDERRKLTTLGIGEFLNNDVIKLSTAVKDAPGTGPIMIYRRIR